MRSSVRASSRSRCDCCASPTRASLRATARSSISRSSATSPSTRGTATTSRRSIGAIDGPLRKWDRRPEGSSLYIRVGDLADGDLADAVVGAARTGDARRHAARRTTERRRCSDLRPPSATTRSASIGDAHLPRRRQRRPRAAHRAAEPAQHRGDQHRRDPRPGRAPALQQGVDRPLRADALPLRACSTRRRSRSDTITDVQGAAPAVRHQVRRAVLPVADDPGPVPRQPRRHPRLPDPAVRSHARRLRPHRHRRAACTRRRPTRSCRGITGSAPQAQQGASRTSSTRTRSTST